MTLRPPPHSTPDLASVLCRTLWVSHVNTRLRNETLAAVHRAQTLRLEAKWRRIREAEAVRDLRSLRSTGDTAKAMSQLDFALVRR